MIKNKIGVLFASIILLCLLVKAETLTGSYPPQSTDFQEKFGVSVSDNIPMIYQQTVLFKISKEGTLYKNEYFLMNTGNDDAISLSLPTNKSLISLDVYELTDYPKNKYIETRQIDRLPDCSGYYQVEEVHNTKIILVCPFRNRTENIIQLEALFYNDQKDELSLKEGYYTFTLKNFLMGYAKNQNYNLRIDLVCDNSLYCEIGPGSCGNLATHFISGGVSCEGIYNGTNNELGLLRDLSLNGQDKEAIAKKDFERQISESWSMANKGIFVAIIIAIISIILSILPEEQKKKLFNYIMRIFR